MLRKLIALLMFVIAMASALSLGAGEHAHACDSSDDVVSMSSNESQLPTTQLDASGTYQADRKSVV